MFSLKSTLFLIIFFTVSSALFAQSDNQLIREGNKKFEEEKYREAEIYYRRALEESPGNSKALYNLSNSLYRQGRYDEAINILDRLTQQGVDKIDASDVYHNLGNAQLGAHQIRQSIESYKNALKIDPDDQDTRYNLAYAMELLDEQEQPPQAETDIGEGEQDQDQPDQDEQVEAEPELKQDEEIQLPENLSREDVERLLDALNRQEQEVQEEIKREAEEEQRITPEKEW